METNEKQVVKGNVSLWTVIGIVAGGLLGSLLGPLGTVTGGVITGIIAYRSSSRNDGNAPAWLWRTKSNQKKGFELNELIKTQISQEELLSVLENHFKKVSHSIQQTGQTIDVKTIKVWPYVSDIISNNTVSLKVKDADDGQVIVADIQYKTALSLWGLVLVTFIFFNVLAIPVCVLLFAWFLLEERSLHIVVTECLQRVNKELEQRNQTISSIVPAS